MARWTTDWDCGYETSFWYVIKDTPFDISVLKSKRRYEINKGNKNFEVRIINPKEYIEQIIDVTMAAYMGWPEKYRPTVNEEGFRKTDWSKWTVFGGFNREDGSLCGYAQLNDQGSYAEFNVLRAKPETEKLAINAAMVAGILDHYNSRFNGSFYINDGSRSIRHETAFQDYLEKYFDFRKAYCKLNVKYRLWVDAIVKAMYPLRKFISPESRLGSKISGILKMEEARRSF